MKFLHLRDKTHPAYEMGYKFTSALLNALGKPEIYHSERVPRTGPLILAANHTSYFDPFALGIAATREVHFMAKDTLFWGPLAWLLPRWNAIPVKRGTADLGALRTALKVLKAGKALAIFPEGTRGMGDDLQAARAGVGFLAARTSAPVLPVFIEGLERVLGRGQWTPRCAQVRLYVGELLTFSPGVSSEEITAQAMDALRWLREHRAEIQRDVPARLG